MMKIIRSILKSEDDVSVAFPFILLDRLERAGFRHSSSDLSIFLLKKSLPPEKGSLFTGTALCGGGEIENLLKNAVSAIRNSDRASLAENVETILRIHLDRIVETGRDHEEADEDLLAVRILRTGDGLEITVWDHGNEWRTEESSPKKFRMDPAIGALARSVRRKNYCGLREYVFTIA